MQPFKCCPVRRIKRRCIDLATDPARGLYFKLQAILVTQFLRQLVLGSHQFCRANPQLTKMGLVLIFTNYLRFMVGLKLPNLIVYLFASNPELCRFGKFTKWLKRRACASPASVKEWP